MCPSLNSSKEYRNSTQGTHTPLTHARAGRTREPEHSFTRQLKSKSSVRARLRQALCTNPCPTRSSHPSAERSHLTVRRLNPARRRTNASGQHGVPHNYCNVPRVSRSCIPRDEFERPNCFRTGTPCISDPLRWPLLWHVLNLFTKRLPCYCRRTRRFIPITRVARHHGDARSLCPDS